MTGRHGAPPVGSGAREATASPYTGKRRAGLDLDPPRCWSCGHPFDAGCECSCCNDDGEPGDE